MSLLLMSLVALFVAGSAYQDTLPSAHLEGSDPREVDYCKDKAITAWNSTDPNSHLIDGFEYDDGKLIVPKTGRYYVYAQMYFIAPEEAVHTPNRVAVKAGNRSLLMMHTDLAAIQQSTMSTGGVFLLAQNDEISVMPIDYVPRMWVGPLHSFFGAYMIPTLACSAEE